MKNYIPSNNNQNIENSEIQDPKVVLEEHT